MSQMFPRPDEPLSGVFVLEQVKSLARLGVDIGVLSPTAQGLVPRFRVGSLIRQSLADGLHVTYVPYTHVPHRISTRLEIRSLVSRILPVVRAEHSRAPIRVLHAHQLFPIGYATVIAGRRLGIPVVCTAHGSDVHTNPHRNRGIARYTRATLRMVDRTVAVSTDLSTRIARLEPRAAPVEVIYNGIDPQRFSIGEEQTTLRRSLGLPEHGVGICFVGRLVAAKGIRELESAFQTVRKMDSTVWMVIVGDGPMRDGLASRVSRDRVILTGPVPHERVADYLNASDVFTLPSHGEGVPVAMLEAMACGLPIVATAVGGIPEAVTDGVTGFLVRPRDRDSLTDRLGSLVKDAELRSPSPNQRKRSPTMPRQHRASY